MAQFAGFGPRTDIPLGENRPTDSASGDFDGDGDIDIAVCFQTSSPANLGRVAVLLNNGDGTFQSPVFYSVGEDPAAIRAADVNLDGDLDLITANTGTNDVSVLRGSTGGAFLPEVFFGVGTGPEDIAVADVNADGRPDIVSANGAASTVSVVAGNGSGTSWTIIGTYSTNNGGGTGGQSPSSIALRDLNANGLPDIVTANSGSASCTVMYNIASSPGSYFSGDFGLFIPVGSNPQDVQLVDIDRDGDIDLVTANRSSSTVSVRLSNRVQTGDTFPNFSGSVNVAVPSGPIAITVADIDGGPSSLDGDPDLIVVSETADRLSVLLNNGSGGLTLDSTYVTQSSPKRAAVVDLDGDGDLDAASPNLISNTISIFLNQSTVIGGPPPTVSLIDPDDGGCLCAGPNTIIGTVNPAAGTVLGGYILEYRRLGNPTYTTIATGSLPVINGSLGSWNTSGLPEGQYLLRLTGSNAGGISASDESVIYLGSDFDTVVARLGAGIDGSEVSIVGRNACIFGSISDSGCGPISYSVDFRPTSGGAFVPVDPANPVYSGGRTNTTLADWDTTSIPDGNYEIRVSAVNGCGDSKTVNFTCTVDNTSPIANIDTPVSCEYRSPGEIIEIKGTASDTNLSSWSVQYTGGSSHGWTTIASGNTNVTSDVLANWDTSGLEPCAYTVRLSVGDQSVLNCDDPGNSAGYLVSFDLRCPADLNGDGEVNFFDVSFFLTAYNAGCP
ncbi:MAG: VCBS repeat-containing protein [Phycisphaerales bacterium]